MGWLFCAETKEELVNRLVRTEENENWRIQVIAHSVAGSQLWMVEEYTAKVQIDAEDWFKGRAAEPGDTFRIIGLALLSKNGGHSAEYCWGYKSMDETVHPFYYSCPLKFLKMVPEACPEWRVKVRKWHADKRDRKHAKWKLWSCGDVVKAGESGKLYVIVSPEYSRGTVQRQLGWVVRRARDGEMFRLTGRTLRTAVRASPGGHERITSYRRPSS